MLLLSIETFLELASCSFLLLFMRTNKTFGDCLVSNHTNVSGLCLQVFHQAGPSLRGDCLVITENKHKVATTKHCQLGNRTRSQQPFDQHPDVLSTELLLP